MSDNNQREAYASKKVIKINFSQLYIWYRVFDTFLFTFLLVEVKLLGDKNILFSNFLRLNLTVNEKIKSPHEIQNQTKRKSYETLNSIQDDLCSRNKHGIDYVQLALLNFVRCFKVAYSRYSWGRRNSVIEVNFHSCFSATNARGC